MQYRRNWIISACAHNWIISSCAHGVNSRALYAYIRECAYNAVIFELHPVNVM